MSASAAAKAAAMAMASAIKVGSPLIVFCFLV
jgi:hypothetical protein